MPLPHFTRLLMTGSPGGPGTQPQEPLYKNLFEITFILPTILQAQGRDPIMMLQQATNTGSLDLTPDIERKEQMFKYSTRRFVGTPTTTSGETTIKFNINVNKRGQIEVWNTLKAWYDLVWNSQNGSLHYKADIIGTLVINQHDRKGLIVRRITLQNAQCYGITSISDLQWGGGAEIFDADAKFVYDYWIDEYIDGNFTIQPPIVAGY